MDVGKEVMPQAVGTASALAASYKDQGGSEKLGEGQWGSGQVRGKVVCGVAEAVGGPGLRQPCNGAKVNGFIMKSVLRSFKQDSGQIRFAFLNELHGF